VSRRADRVEAAALRRVIALLELDRRRLAGAVAAGSAGLGSAVALAAVSAWLIARASQMPPVLDLSVAVVAVRGLGISRAVFRYVERLASHSVALHGVAALRERLYSCLAAGRSDAVMALRRGDVLARTGADVDAVGDVVVRALLPAAVSAVLGLGTVVLVACFLPSAALVLLVALLLAGVVSPMLTARAVRIAELAALHERGDLAATAMTAVESAGELVVSGRTPALLGELDAADRRLARAADVAAGPAAAAAALNLAAMGLAVLGAVLLGIPATTAGTLAPVELAVVVLVPLAAFEATGMLPAAAAQLVRSGGAARRIVDLLDAAAAAPPGRTADGVTMRQPSGSPTLVARGLTCAWPDGPVVLESLDLDLRPGRSVAIVGASGVGKTTLLLTLAGLLPARAGTVRVSGDDPWLLDRADVSRSLVLTAEDAHVFETSLLENLRVGRGDVTPEAARAVLDQVGLGPWLASLPAGLDTPLGTDGTTVSGGERRRLLVARALLTRAPLLLLDEPAEHLDPAAADALIGDLLRVSATPERGVALVTHRLTALGAADEVVLLGPADGAIGSAARASAPATAQLGPARMIARGTHAELTATVPAYAWALAQEETETMTTGPALPKPGQRPDPRAAATTESERPEGQG
jgi:ATP-binding cassette subfamily C protein CydC